jgi:hypothetical protein
MIHIKPNPHSKENCVITINNKGPFVLARSPRLFNAIKIASRQALRVEARIIRRGLQRKLARARRTLKRLDNEINRPTSA